MTGVPLDPDPQAPSGDDGRRRATVEAGASTGATVSVNQARLAGVLGAGVALGVSEIVTGLASGNQSLVGSVGNAFIRASGGGVARTAISVLGTADKPSLVLGIVVVSLVAGAALGTASLKRRWVAMVGFAAFGLVGIVASARDPLASTAVAVVAAALAVAAGLGTLFGLLHVATTGHLLPTAPPPAASRSSRPVVARPTDATASRRAFLGWAGAAGAFAVTGTLAGRTLRGRSTVEAARQKIRLVRPTNQAVPPGSPAAFEAPGTASFPVDGLSPYLVPNADFYRIDTALVVPQIDVASWKLSVTGMVDHPFTVTFDDLQRMAQVEEAVTLSCVSNEVGGDLVGNALWQGVPLRDAAGPGRGAVRGQPDRGPVRGRVHRRVPHRRPRRRPHRPGGGGHERRAVAHRARLPGPPGGGRAVRVRVGLQVAPRDPSRSARATSTPTGSRWAGPRRRPSRPSRASTCPARGRPCGPAPPRSPGWPGPRTRGSPRSRCRSTTDPG